jgi:outer membrane protein TolC
MTRRRRPGFACAAGSLLLIVIVLVSPLPWVRGEPPPGPRGYYHRPVFQAVLRRPNMEMQGPPPAVEEPVPAEPTIPAEPVADAVADLKPLTATLSLNVEPRPLSLRDAIQISLAKSDVVRTLGSGGVQIESVTGYDPEIMRMRSNVAATVFDPKLTTGYVGSRIDEPSGTFFGPGIPQNVRRDEGDFIASISKSWSTGATASVGYLPPLGYLFYPNGTAGQFNPAYTSDLVFQATQPLLRGAGWTVNLAPIRIAQLKAEQSAWDCKQATMAQVRSVETAYWDLQSALLTLDAVENVLPLMNEIVRIETLRMESELSTRADVARASMQFDNLQQQRFQSRNDAVAKELRLRNLLAMDLSDQNRLVPSDFPRRAPVALDHAAAMANALESRPDLVRQRLGLRIRELEYAVARNGVKPQLDLQALYRSNGIGQNLNTSLQQMIGFGYTDWTLGATFSIPLGNRAARGNLEVAEMQLTRDRALLNQTIQNLGYTLADLMRESETAFAQFELAHRRVLNSQEWIRSAKIRYSNPPPAEDGNQNWLLLALYDYQNALKMHVDAVSDAGQLLARYNTQLARLEEAQGILLENRGIELNDDPCVAVRRNADKLFGAPRQVQPPPSAGTVSNPPVVNEGPGPAYNNYRMPAGGSWDPNVIQHPLPSQPPRPPGSPLIGSPPPVPPAANPYNGGINLPPPGHSTGPTRVRRAGTVRPTNFTSLRQD